MSLSKKIEEILKDELNSDNIKTVIDIAEYLKFKESKGLWNAINEEPQEYLSQEERKDLESIKSNAEFIDQEDLLIELGISKDEL